MNSKAPEVVAFEAYKKSFPSKQNGVVKDIRKNNSTNHGTVASVGLRSGTSSMADASVINVSSNNNQISNQDGTHSPIPPNSAPETVTDMSARRPTSKKAQFGASKDSGDYTKNAGTQPQPSRHSNLSNNAQKMQVVKQTYAMPTHRRSNTAASFVP